jgi:Asp-tRNA(Asn)/Glu-tRNA(Gln) amidotransferase A subunit family amidase
MPMGLSYHGLPMGLELDGRPGEDVKLLDLAAQVSAVLGPIPPPSRV